MTEKDHIEAALRNIAEQAGEDWNAPKGEPVQYKSYADLTRDNEQLRQSLATAIQERDFTRESLTINAKTTAKNIQLREAAETELATEIEHYVKALDRAVKMEQGWNAAEAELRRWEAISDKSDDEIRDIFIGAVTRADTMEADANEWRLESQTLKLAVEAAIADRDAAETRAERLETINKVLIRLYHLDQAGVSSSGEFEGVKFDIIEWEIVLSEARAALST